MSSKRILYISQYYPPEVGAGAVRSESIVSKLAEEGWEVDVITEIPNYPIGERFPGYEKGNYFVEQLENGVTIHRIFVHITKRRDVREQLSLFLSFMFSVFFYVLRLGKKYDVVYSTSPPLFAGFSALLLSKILGAKFVFEVRDLWPDSAKDSFRSDKSIVYKLGLWLEKTIYKGSSLVVSVTKEAKKIILKKCPDINVKVVNNGVDTRLFRPIPENEIEIDEEIDRSKFNVGYVGSLGVIHDLETLIRTAKLCEIDSDIQFILVGDGGRNNLLKNIMDKIKPVNVTWVGLKPYDKVPHYISMFDVAVNPMKKKKIFDSVITVKFYEYLACGIPVITSDLKSMAKVANKSDASILFETGNEHDLKNQIIRLKNDVNEMNKLRKNSMKFIHKHFDRADLASELIKKMSNILD